MRDRRRVGLALADQAIVSGVNFATAAAVGRWAGAEELGLYALAFSLLVLLQTVHESLILTPYAVRVPRVDDRHAELGAVLVQSTLFMTAATIVLGAVGFAITFADGTEALSEAMLAVAVVAPFTLLREFARRVAYAHLRVGVAALVDGAAACLQITTIVALIAVDEISATSALLAAAIGCGASGIVWLALSRQRITLRDVGARAMQSLSLGGWIAASRLTSVACAQVVPWLLAWRVSLTAAGGFAAASTLVAAANPLLMGIGAVFLPHASRDYAEGGVRRLHRSARRVGVWMAVISSIVIGLLTVGAEALLSLIYGAGFGPFASTAVVLSLALLLSTAGFGAETALRVLERPRLDFIASVLSLATACVITLALVDSWGPLGGAAALATGAGLASGVRIAAFLAVRRDVDRQSVAPAVTDSVS